MLSKINIFIRIWIKKCKNFNTSGKITEITSFALSEFHSTNNPIETKVAIQNPAIDFKYQTGRQTAVRVKTKSGSSAEKPLLRA